MQLVHKFGGWNGSDIFQDKVCLVCKTTFKPKSGAHKFCSPQCKGKWQYITGSGSTENQYKEISGNWRRYFARLIGKKYRSELSLEILSRILEEQKGVCALSGVPLTCTLIKGQTCKTNASIDRIIAGGPYTEDNVQLVCAALNKWRSDTPLQEFIEWCRKVASFHESGGKVNGAIESKA